MFKRKTDTAILLFTNAASKEVTYKNILNGESLFEHLTQQTIRKAEKTGLDLVVYTDDLQIGTTFGERFANAIADVFSKGYKNIITIGNDSPDLQSKQLLTAHQNFQKQQNTLGPSIDGGVYLIGISKHQFEKESFAALPWQTTSVRQALQNYLVKEATNSIHLLTTLKDIDAKQDLYHFVQQFKYKTHAFRQIILALLQQTIVSVFINATKPRFIYTKLLYNKGSPTIL
ncbi:TIGR04282 family arsenosugar biosynthesis glycosyltransferase [Tenacibaculum amylolyticum]|uniref:TIGR04282 family arsenosugar biosynthesis glycosyltransferase n=1 Tax=Tenacibaculum amylolyticum TaxID=104269 RepID=UPI003892D5DA